MTASQKALHELSPAPLPARLEALAVVLEKPGEIRVRTLALDAPGDADVVVDVEWSGISTGTEKLLWSGRMPPFPGLAFPLVPGYETVGTVSAAGPASGLRQGDRVFVPGARCYGPVAGLFGGAARRLVVPGARVALLPEGLGEEGVLLALAATAWHVTAGPDASPPDLIIGHGVLGRLLARIALAGGAQPPVVWETNPARVAGATGYPVLHPDADTRRDYRAVIDASGDAAIIDAVLPRIARGGEIVLAGFYSERVGFNFPPAFLRELRLRVAAEWAPADLAAVLEAVQSGRLSLDGLVTHRSHARRADAAYRTAFGDIDCLKMVLDWRSCP